MKDRFTTNAGKFLPIFDPILDAFDSLRSREPFCFAVILVLACRIYGIVLDKKCLDNVRQLAAVSMFQYPASSGKVQAMILLSAYTETTWFAVGHALQMASDLSIEHEVLGIQGTDQRDIHNSPEGQLQTNRNTRLWLAICSMEKEIAIGNAKSSRVRNINPNNLERFLHQSQAPYLTVRLTSLVEAVQVRGKASVHTSESKLALNYLIDEILTDIAADKDLAKTGVQALHVALTKFEQWFQKWDSLHQGMHSEQWISFRALER